MPQVRLHSSSTEITPLVDALIEETKRQIGELKENIAQLVAEGHEVTDATKHLNAMIEKLQTMKSRPKAS